MEGLSVGAQGDTVRSSRAWLAVRAAVVGAAVVMLLGGCVGNDGGEDGATPAPSSSVSSSSTTAPSTTAPASTTAPSTTAVEEDQVEEEVEEAVDENPAAAVVMAGGLTPEFLSVIEETDGVQQVAVIVSGQLRLAASADASGTPVDQLADGFVIPLDARAYASPAAAAPFAPDLMEVMADLAADEVVLSESSAELRRLDIGSVITFDNDASFRVGAVLPDALVGSSKVILIGPDALQTAGADNPRQVALVHYDGTGEDLERVLLAANDGEGIRVFGGRGGDDRQGRDRAVLAQIRVKEIFGEFSYRPRSGGAVEIEQAWVDANIVTVDFPLLGQARCHRVYADVISEVMQGLIDDGLSDVIDPAAFQGCWNPRFIGGSDRLSRHAWGIAVDLNFFNPLDDQPGSPVHPELLDRMGAAGVTSGHNWSTPDPGHFEYLTDG